MVTNPTPTSPVNGLIPQEKRDTMPLCPDLPVLTRAQDKLLKRLNMLKSGAFLLIVEDGANGQTFRLVLLPKIEMLG